MPTLNASFETRRDAEMAVERMVQEFGLDRSTILVAPEGSENTSGEVRSGGDNADESAQVSAREDGAHNGKIRVSVNIEDTGEAQKVREAFAEFEGDDGGIDSQT
ncbi:hypothetical protein [Paracoccus sp. S1E-3]|uniref:hypothetical protein n=1 Tax=Paracoccus sp. S1E-3 TaxID=2756130 RepID=UPI0015EF1A9C|nr:hypothetical protein [Paracoccus sp. S1E-3]MBA4491610.1 hypothetical protein [Paracoccus sp. S1E-3]